MIKFRNQKHVSTMLKPLLSIAVIIDLEKMADYQRVNKITEDEIFNNISKDFNSYVKEVFTEGNKNEEI